MALQKNVLLDYLLTELQLRNDRQLAARLKVGPPSLSKIRAGVSPVSASMLVVMHEASSIDLRVLRHLSGDFRNHTGKSAQLLTVEECARSSGEPAASAIRELAATGGVSIFRRNHGSGHGPVGEL